MGVRVVVVGLASDFGCQVQLTNIEDDLLDVLSMFDLAYWQLASSGHMPEEYDVAIVEGSVTTDAHVKFLERVRKTADVVIAMGACAVTGGIPALASRGFEDRYECVYGAGDAQVACGRIAPLPVDAVIPVDYRVPGCPVEPSEFLHVLGRALQGLADRMPDEPMCAVCKMRENVCFFDKGELCMGPVTRTGCRAKCISLGRPCTGCRGVAAGANFEAATELLEKAGYSLEEVLERVALYNTGKGGYEQ